MNKKSFLSVQYFPLIVLLIILLTMLFLHKDNHYILLSIFYLFLYCSFLIFPYTLSPFVVFFLGIIIDSFYNVSVGIFTFVFMASMLVVHLQSKYIKNNDFIKSFIFFFINTFALMAIINLINFILPTNFHSALLFILLSCVFFPIIFSINKMMLNFFDTSHE